MDRYHVNWPKNQELIITDKSIKGWNLSCKWANSTSTDKEVEIEWQDISLFTVEYFEADKASLVAWNCVKIDAEIEDLAMKYEERNKIHGNYELSKKIGFGCEEDTACCTCSIAAIPSKKFKFLKIKGYAGKSNPKETEFEFIAPAFEVKDSAMERSVLSNYHTTDEFLAYFQDKLPETCVAKRFDPRLFRPYRRRRKKGGDGMDADFSGYDGYDGGGYDGGGYDGGGDCGGGGD